MTIASYKAKCIEKFGAQEAFGRPETNEEFLERQRNVYRVMLDAGGEIQYINQGSDLAIALIETHRTLESWRLLKRLIAICKQHHGQKHWFTSELEKILHNNCKKHLVGV